MKKFILVVLIFTGLSACIIEKQGAEMKSEFRKPFTYEEWKTEMFKTVEGKTVCAITSGYNSLSVALRRKKDNTLGVSVKSERDMSPGMTFTVNANGNRYFTAEEYFTANSSASLTNDLISGEKAYLEWSKPHGGRHGRLRYTDIIKLDGFKAKFEQCRNSVLK